MLKHYRKLKAVALVTCAAFAAMLISPGPVMAHHGGGLWYGNGTVIPTDTAIASAPENTELNAPDLRSPCLVNDPVNLQNGDFLYDCPDLQIPGRGMDVTINHEYRAGSNFNGMFGFGWTINYYERLRPMSDSNVVLLNGTIRKDKYVFNGTVYAPPAGRYENNVQNADGSWSITDAHGLVKNYDLNGNLTSITDPNGNQIRLEYDPAGPIPLSGPRLFPNGQTTGVIGMDYRLVRIIDTVGRIINFRYNASGLLSEIEDFAGRKVTYGYDPATNDLLTITLPATAEFPNGLIKTFAYDAGHNLTSITDPKGQVFVTNHYNADGKVDRQDLGEGTWLSSYNGNKTTTTDRKGHVVKYTFNPAGQAEVIERFTEGIRPDDPPSFISRYTYNADGLMTSMISPKGNGVKIIYDDLNSDFRSRRNLLQVRRKADMAAADNDAADLVTRLTYEPRFNRIKTLTDAKGNVTTFTYDYELPTTDPRYGTAGNLVYIDQPLVNGAVPRTTFGYNSFGQPKEMIDPNGNKVTYDYFPATGYLKEVRRDPAGINALTSLTYDAFGNPDTVTDPENHITNFDFNEQNLLIKITNPLGFVTKIFHDANGNVEHTERQANPAATEWQIIQFTYTNLNKIKTITDPLNRVTTFNYDLNENLQSILDAENHTTTYEYDERNLLYRTLDANIPQGITVFAYDDNGNILNITDAKGNITKYEFDLFDRKHIETYPDTTFTQLDYDKNSNLIRNTTPSSAVLEFDYDALNRLRAKRHLNNAALNSTYNYDVGSRLTAANNAASQIGFTYDALNRVETNTQTLGPNPYTLTYSYYKNDTLFHQTYPSGKVLEYLYDLNDQLTDIKVNSVNKVHYAYDTLDRRDFRDYLTGITQREDYTFDIADQLQGITNTAGTAGVSQFGYTYDNVGNRKTMTTLAGLHTYNYNDIYELKGVTGAQTHVYNYDNVGNRLTTDSVVYAPNELNQYAKVGAVNFSYDDNGNLTTDGTNTYGYDAENRMLSASNVFNTSGYVYDALNRRIGKTVNGTTVYFVYADDDIIEERTSAGALAADYLYGSDTDEILSMTRAGNEYWYFHDGLGSVTDLTRPNGTIAESYTYDPYGTPSITSAVGNPFMFTGRQWDAESEIYYYRRRYYDPVIGRFLSRDPLDSGLGLNFFPHINTFQQPLLYLKPLDEVNPYLYTGNNPINRIDPSGLWYIDINGSIGYWGGGTGGIVIGPGGIYTYAGGGVVSPGVGGAITVSPQNVNTGWNVGGQVTAGFAYQYGYSFKDKSNFWEAGIGWPLSGSVTGYYVNEPWTWPWQRDWWPWKDKKKPCEEGNKK